MRTLPVLQVATSLSLASTRSEVLESSLSRLNGSLQLSLAEVAALKESEERLNRLSASFEVLLKDAGRHSQVLEQLLGGEDVLDFLVLPEEEQNEYSVPALLEQLRQHSLSIETLQGGQQPGELPPPVHHLVLGGTRGTNLSISLPSDF